MYRIFSINGIVQKNEALALSQCNSLILIQMYLVRKPNLFFYPCDDKVKPTRPLKAVIIFKIIGHIIQLYFHQF